MAVAILDKEWLEPSLMASLIMAKQLYTYENSSVILKSFEVAQSSLNIKYIYYLTFRND